MGVVLWDGDVVVGDFGRVSCLLLSVPHDVVQVWKVMIQVYPFVTVSSLSPAGQFWALQGISMKAYFPLCFILYLRLQMFTQWYCPPPPHPPFISALSGLFYDFDPLLPLYPVSLYWPAAALGVCIWVQFVQLRSVTEALFKKKTHKKGGFQCPGKRAFSFPPLHKQLRSLQDSWTAGGGFGSQSPAEPHAGCPSCILCTSTAWGWGRALGRGPRCRASPPRSETLALLPTGAFRLSVGQREHENPSTSGSSFNPSS